MNERVIFAPFCPLGHRTFHDVPEGSCSAIVRTGRESFSYVSGPCARVAEVAAKLAFLDQHFLDQHQELAE